MALAGEASPTVPPASAILLLATLLVLAASAVVPWQTGWITATAAIVVFGVPHGALDVEIGRTLFRARWGRAWFPVFALPYLALVALVLVGWHAAPEAALALFLLASVWHFGSEDAGGGVLPAIAAGGLPIALPVLLHPAATARFLSAVSGLTLATPPGWLTVASLVWLLPMTTWIVREITGRHARKLAVPGAIGCAFVVLPPLMAFALYFVIVHAPAHMRALVRNAGRMPRAGTVGRAWILAAPATLLTILIGAALWPFYSGAAAVRLVCLTLQMLAAFTLPHMLLDGWLNWRDKVSSRRGQLRTGNRPARPVRGAGGKSPVRHAGT